jgi:hypothetical protein
MCVGSCFRRNDRLWFVVGDVVGFMVGGSGVVLVTGFAWGFLLGLL